jgi:hypothetical protein
MRQLPRRRFLAAATLAPWLVRQAAAVPKDRQECLSSSKAGKEGLPSAVGAKPPKPIAKPKPILDIHVHLMGVGDAGSGCRLSADIQERFSFKVLAYKFQLRRRARSLDEGYVLALAEQLQQSGLDKAVILAHDAVYDGHGRLDPKRTRFYVPNDYLLQVTARYPKLMVPCVSINPDRADATDELDRCVQMGARVLKIHPPIQGVDIAKPKHSKFFRRCAEKKVVVMVHTGHEHAGPVIDVELARPEKLRLALDQGCTVVACHCGTGQPSDRPDMLPGFLKLLRDYQKQGNLWGDTAILGSFRRSRDLGRLLADELARSRLLHGSDFPFPALPLEFAGKIGIVKAAAIQLDPNFIRQDFALKVALGIGRPSAERAYDLISPRNATSAPHPS